MSLSADLKKQVEELHQKSIEQYRNEIEAKDRLSKAAEAEINRVWLYYRRALSVISLIVVCATGAAAVIGFKGYQAILAEIKNEVHNQLSDSQKIQEMINEDARETIASWAQTNTDLLGNLQINAIYNNLKTELINCDDTNKVYSSPSGVDGVSTVVVCLSKNYILNSLHITATKGEHVLQIFPRNEFENVFTFINKGSISGSSLLCEYVVDTRSTNQTDHLTVVGGNVSINNRPILIITSSDKIPAGFEKAPQ